MLNLVCSVLKAEMSFGRPGNPITAGTEIDCNNPSYTEHAHTASITVLTTGCDTMRSRHSRFFLRCLGRQLSRHGTQLRRSTPFRQRESGLYMGPFLNDNLLDQYIRTVYPNGVTRNRDLLWDWRLSRVERVFLDGGGTFILKRSRHPLTDEARVIHSLRESDVPVPELVMSCVDEDILTMILEDLGPPVRQPTLSEAASAAVALHRTAPPEWLPVLDEAALRMLPARIRRGVEDLTSSGRWQEVDEVCALLDRIIACAPRISRGASTPPFGLCHSEFHPTSLHVGTHRTAVVDWARAFIGPGLLDLASYGGTIDPPDPAACRSLIEAYRAAGGSEEATDQRGGLPAQDWAIVWHRLWAVDWYVESCNTWMTERELDSIWQSAVERHLGEAASFI